MRHHRLSLVLVLGLQACAFQAAMKHGDDAALAQDWGRAYDAYRFADELKPGKAAEDVTQARFAAAGAELVAAEAALQAKDFAKAGAHMERAEEIDPAHIRLETVRSAARAAMAAELAARMESAENLRGTYELAVLAKRIDPTAPQFEDATAAMRDRVATDARALSEEGRYAEARVVARTIAEVEPEQATRGAKLDQKVTDTWVAALVRQADAAQERPGLAAVYFARAYEVGGDPEHREASESALEAAAPAASLKVFVDSKGDGGRHWRLRKSLRTTVEASPGVEPGWTSSWDLQATLYSGAERCKETKTAAPLAKEFVSGSREVPNPAYVEVAASLTQAEKARDLAKAALAKSQKSLDPVAAQAKVLEGVRDEEQRAYEATVARQVETDRQLKIAQDRHAQLVTMASGGDPAMVATAKSQEGVVAEWVEKSATEQQAVALAKKRVDTANTKLDPVKAAAETQGAATKEAEARFAAADKTATDLIVKKRETAPTLTEDVKETFKYAETTWTLTCDATATVYFGTRWKTALAKKQSFPVKNSTTDVSRPGHRMAGIEEDAKSYPRSQTELVAELDDTKAIAAAIEAFVDESYDRRVEAALASSNTSQATDTLMALYAGVPERFDNAARVRLVEHLKTHYGIEKPAVLGIEPAPEPAPPAQETPATPPAEGEPGATSDAAVEEVATGKAGAKKDN